MGHAKVFSDTWGFLEWDFTGHVAFLTPSHQCQSIELKEVNSYVMYLVQIHSCHLQLQTLFDLPS